MTGVRQSIVFQIEDTFGEGCPAFEDEFGLPKYYWVHAPPGSWFTSTHRRDTKRVQSMGSKFWDTVSYGPLSGTWEWTFYLDYRYPEPLFLIFEGSGTSNVKAMNVLQFTKSNNIRVPSFTVRVKVLDTPVDGVVNEVHTLKGCVVTSAVFTKQSSSSYVQVKMSGFYSNESINVYDDELMNTTDYVEYDGELVEYACLTSSQLTGKEFDNAALIQNTDSVTISIENSAEAIYNTCAPFALNYAEGLTKITLSASSYANHPTYYQYGVLTGGEDFNIVEALAQGITIYPGSKNMAPLPVACLTSYNAMARDTSGIVGRAYGGSTLSSVFRLTDVVMSAITHQKGDSGKLMDSISNCPAKLLELTLTSLIDAYTLSTGEEAWKDRFYYVPDEVESFKNNVFEEKTHVHVDENGIVYRLDDVNRTASLFSLPENYSGDENGHLEIPSMIIGDNGKGYMVTEIYAESCRNTVERPVTIRSVNIPPTVKNIELNAFRGVTTLESVTGGLPTEEYPDGGVRRINAGAFFMSSTASSLTVCDMLSSEDTMLEEVYPYAFTYTHVSKIYISSKCRYYMSSANNPYTFGPFSLMGIVQEIKLPLSLDFTGENENGTLFQGLFYKTYSRRFVFYQDNHYESQRYISDDIPIDVGNVSQSQATEQVIQAGVPAFVSPWYWSIKKFESLNVELVFESSVKDIPDGMFMLPDDITDNKKYILDPSVFPQFKSIGAYSFYNSYYKGANGPLELTGSVGQYAFYNPVGITSVRISSASLLKIGPRIIVNATGSPSGITSIDLGGCTRLHSRVEDAFEGIGDVQSVVVPTQVTFWFNSAIISDTPLESPLVGWYRMGAYDGNGNLTKLAMYSRETRITNEDAQQYMRGQVIEQGGTRYVVPRRFFREAADQDDIGMGAIAELNTVAWTNASWNSVSNTTWGSWGQYMWGELGQYRRFINPSLNLNMASPGTRGTDSVLQADVVGASVLPSSPSNRICYDGYDLPLIIDEPSDDVREEGEFTFN